MFNGLFKRKQQRKEAWDLCQFLLSLGGKEWLSVAAAVCGTLIVGQTGSGKSTSSAAHLAHAMLRNGKFGGLVLSVKSERETWVRYCRDAGRLADLVTIDANCNWRFNPLDHEVTRAGAGAGHVENVLRFLVLLMETISREKAGGDGREDAAFWKNSTERLMRAAISVCILAYGRVTVEHLYQVILSAPASPAEVRSPEWREKSFCFRSLTLADHRSKSECQERDFALDADYFLIEYPCMSDKTRSIIVASFTSLIDVMQRGLLRDLFGGDTTISPEAVEEGKILLVDVPVKHFGPVGLIANQIWKLSFQKSIERRDLRRNGRPVFLWADEGHHFLHKEDSLWQSTCRSSRVASVLITQNIPNLDVALGGGDTGRAQAESLIANFGTIIAHCNTCQRSNDLFAGMIGRSIRTFANGNMSQQVDDWPMTALGLGGSGQTSGGFSEQLSYTVEPSEFTRLRTGGPQNKWEAGAIVIKSGETFKSTGRIYKPVTFKQRI